ncbi:restriction endonuclease subunit S [Lactococcus lactis]|uniref:restriction endonuclease subunit S n=1 Tax=Lactococcus lactis TaxID=1358 RepID=UPI000513777B|nr:restriction endonuclease subunit S [Lactococcus lactis]KGF77137.1 Type I restriction-modification system, specificity subunit S [Lactococcus lactis]
MTSENNLYVEKNKAEVSKNVPELRFQGFIDAWEQRKLSDLMTFSNGINAPKENYGTGTKMISVMDILNPLPIKYDNILNSVAVDKKIEDKNKVEKGDLIFVRSSEIVEEVGWAKAYKEDRYALYSGFAIRGKRISSYNAYFIELTLNYANRKEVERRAGGSTRFNVSQEILNSLTVLTPLISEQNQIDLFFTKIDNTIALHQQKLSQLELMKKGFLQQLFPENGEKVPKVRFSNFEDEWELRKLKDIISSELKGKAKAEMYGTASPYLETNFLNGGEVSYVDSPIDVDKDDVIILWDGSQAGTVYHGFKGALGSTLKSYSPKESGEYLYQYLKLNQQVIYDSYRTPNIPHVIKTFTKEFNVHFTCYEEQDKVGSFLNQLDEAIDLYQSKVDKLKLLKKGFLQKIFI